MGVIVSHYENLLFIIHQCASSIHLFSMWPVYGTQWNLSITLWNVYECLDVLSEKKKESTFLHSHSQDVCNDSDGPGGNRGAEESTWLSHSRVLTLAVCKVQSEMCLRVLTTCLPLIPAAHSWLSLELKINQVRGISYISFKTTMWDVQRWQSISAASDTSVIWKWITLHFTSWTFELTNKFWSPKNVFELHSVLNPMRQTKVDKFDPRQLDIVIQQHDIFRLKTK